MNKLKVSVTLETAIIGVAIMAFGALGTLGANYAAADPRLAAAVGVATALVTALVGNFTTSYRREVAAGKPVTFAEFGMWFENAFAQFVAARLGAVAPAPVAAVPAVQIATPTSEAGIPTPAQLQELLGNPPSEPLNPDTGAVVEAPVEVRPVDAFVPETLYRVVTNPDGSTHFVPVPAYDTPHAA